MSLRDQILSSLATNERAVAKALVLLYRRQTADEQEAQTTCHVNGRGFNAADASLLTLYAERVLRGERLSFERLHEARNRLRKYVGQLEDEAIAKDLRKLETRP